MNKTDQQQNKKTPLTDPEQGKAPGGVQVMKSVLAAAFGVQSSKNRERDFQHGNHKVFIIAGIIFTLLFLVTVITIVQVVLS